MHKDSLIVWSMITLATMQNFLRLYNKAFSFSNAMFELLVKDGMASNTMEW